MTEKLFYDDPYLCEFSATMIEAIQCESGWRVQLDRTAFYPEGGGQPADKGSINGIEVYDVQKNDGIIYHYLKEQPEGTDVSGEIDWDHRFDYMQQHTGQHILSAVLKRASGAATVAVHQAEDYTSIEIDQNNFDDHSIAEIEEVANALVCANQPVYSYLNGNTPITSFPIRRETKYSENVRLVQIGGDSLSNAGQGKLDDASEMLNENIHVSSPGIKDLAACGGVHTTRTGEVGLIKFKGQEKVRGRVRLFWLIGNRAYRDYGEKSTITDKIGEFLSVPLNGINSEFDRFVSTLGDEKKKNSDLLKEMAFLKAEEIRNDFEKGRNSFLFENMDPAYFKKTIISLSSYPDMTICLLNVRENEGQWALLSTGEKKFDFNHFRNELLPIVDGKGGGKPPLWQGKLGSCSDIEGFQKKFELSVS